MATFREIKDRVLRRLTMQDGVSVQPYADAKIADMIQTRFTMLYDKRFWRRHRITTTYTLTGTDGLVTADLSAVILSYTDIQNIFMDGDDRPMPELTSDFNPSRVLMRFYESYAVPAKLFRVLPVTTTGDIVVRYRTRPAAFNDADTVPFDDEAIIAGVAMDYLTDKGTNPQAVANLTKTFEGRINQLEMLEIDKPKSMHDPGDQSTNEWRDV